MVKLEPLVCLALMDFPVNLDPQDHPDVLDHQETPEPQDQREKQELPVPRDQWEPRENVETMVLLDHLEMRVWLDLMDFQEQLVKRVLPVNQDLLVPPDSQDLEDHQVCPVTRDIKVPKDRLVFQVLLDTRDQEDQQV